jgi:hypothetical protein
MIYTIIALFSLAALLGMILLSYVFRDKETPKGFVFTHGPIAAIALVLLIIYSFQTPGLLACIILFVMAAGGGLVLVYHDIKGMKIPKWLAIFHGLIAVSGFTYLLIKTFG